MKRFTNIVGAILIGLLALTAIQVFAGAAQEKVNALAPKVDADGNASADLKKMIKDKLLPMCTDEVFVSAVEAQNAKGMTLDQIKKIDEEWINAEEPLPIHDELMNNACAKEIRKLATANPAITECFVMDNQGANVGQNVMTSDYWQGDEPKWINSYNGGKGGVEIEEARLDKSTNRVDQKVALPIIDASGNVIGAICIGVSI